MYIPNYVVWEGIVRLQSSSEYNTRRYPNKKAKRKAKKLRRAKKKRELNK